MDMVSESILANSSEPTALDQINNGSPINNYLSPPVCSLCRMMPSTDSFPYVNIGTVGVCGHCKFLLLEDLGTQTDDLNCRRLHRARRSRNSSSESIEDFFSQQFSEMMNMARHNQSLVSEHHDSPGDSDVISRLLQRTSSRSTPDGSRRWRGMSDTESDGFDNLDYLYGESESNISFGARIFQGDSDTVSVSVYGGDSDAATEGHSFLEMETFTQSIERDYLDSDSDIDPMHAGLITWDSDDRDDIEEEYGSEDTDVEENAAEVLDARFLSETGLGSGGGSPVHTSRNPSLALEHGIHLRIRERRHSPIFSIFSNLDESVDITYPRYHRGHLNVRGFEELFEHLAENDNSRRGAPPAAESFVNNLPRLVVNENQKKSDEVVCAICKDMLLVGREAIQLPCFHLYHPCCILPWLGRRNSCPLCRYELPTDDTDYEDGKHNANASSRDLIDIHEIQRQVDSSSDVSDPIEVVEAEIEIQQELRNLSNAINDTHEIDERRSWSFLAAAPIVSLLGIVFVLWLGKPLGVRQRKFHDPSQTSSCSENQRQSRKWWRWF